MLLLEICWLVDRWDRGTCDLVAREYPLQPALSLTTWWETREKPRWTIHQQFLRTPELPYNWLISVKMAILSLKLPIFSCQAIQLQLKIMKNSETNFQQTMQKTWKFTFIAKTSCWNPLLDAQTAFIRTSLTCRVVCEAIENIGVNDGGGNHCQAMWAMLWGNAPPPKNVIPPRTPDWMAFLPAQGQWDTLCFVLSFCFSSLSHQNMVIMQSWADNEGKWHLCLTTQTGKIKLSSKCLEAEFLNFCWKCQVPDQLTGHCFFPCLKKASLEVKWKGKAIACHLLARSWELFSNEHRSTASTPQCSVVSGRERFNIYVSIGERLHDVFL